MDIRCLIRCHRKNLSVGSNPNMFIFQDKITEKHIYISYLIYFNKHIKQCNKYCIQLTLKQETEGKIDVNLYDFSL